jgi:hypothetical protein
MPSSVHVETLRRAAQVLGGQAALREFLRVSMRQLDLWMQGAERPPAYIFLKLVDLISAEPGPGAAELVRRAVELRHKAWLVNEAAQAARDHADEAVSRAAAAVAFSRGIRASLLRRSTLEARPSKASAEEFAAIGFAPTDDRLVVDLALRAALNSTAAQRANIQLAAPDRSLRIVSHVGFKDPFLRFFERVGDAQPSACGAAHKRARRIVVPDVESDPIFAGTAAADVMLAAEARAVQSTPLVGIAGQVIGMLSTHYEKTHEPSAKELAAIDLIAQRAGRWLDGAAAGP